MSNHDKFRAGELFILGFHGGTIPKWLLEFEKRFGLGGVILFDYYCQTKKYDNNIHSLSQVKDLCRALSFLPSRPLVFVDQEGGKVRRLKEKLGFAHLPSQQDFNLLNDDAKYEVALKSFRELRDLGIHYNLAPVVDLNYNPLNPDIGAVGRSYADNPEDVRNNVSIINRVAKETHLGLCLKHFPGLGGARTNSHEELTDLSDAVFDEQIELFFELAPELNGSAILVSHGVVNQWEKGVPASMSNCAIGMLRERLPDVLLVSDDLQMQGLQRKYPTREACVRGISAGLDMMIVGNNMMPQEEEVFVAADDVARKADADPEFEMSCRFSLERVRSRKIEFVKGAC